MLAVLATARELLNCSEAALRQRLGPDLSEFPGSDYQSLDDVSEFRNPNVFSGSVYVREGRVRLVYVSSKGLTGISSDDLEKELEGQPVLLRSRAGKAANMYVRAGEGVAYSADFEEVHFLEVFPKCTLDEYQTEIYAEPGPFIR